MFRVKYFKNKVSFLKNIFYTVYKIHTHADVGLAQVGRKVHTMTN